MKKKQVLFFLTLTLLIIFTFYIINSLLLNKVENFNSITDKDSYLLLSPEVKYDFESVNVEIKGDDYTLLVADSNEEQARGLGGVEYLDEYEGMIFIFDTPDFYVFWMRDTLIPLDIIWLDENKRVVYIKHEAQPESYFETPPAVYTPTSKALYVIELNGGQSERISLKIGDIIEF